MTAVDHALALDGENQVSRDTRCAKDYPKVSAAGCPEVPRLDASVEPTATAARPNDGD